MKQSKTIAHQSYVLIWGITCFAKAHDSGILLGKLDTDLQMYILHCYF